MKKKISAFMLLGISTLAPPFIFGVETGTGTNQTANLCATNSIILRGSAVTNWQELPADWSYYAAASNVNLGNKELTNVTAITLGDDRRTNWPGQIITFLAQGAAYQWANQPAALTEFLGATRQRTKMDLSGYSRVRLTVVVASANTAANAGIRAQYSTDQTSWYYLDGSSGPGVLITSTGLKVSDWVDLASAAKQDVYLRLVGINGNGANDPTFGLIIMQVK